MMLSRELPDYGFALRSANGRCARVNEQRLERSFILAPDTLVDTWQVDHDARQLQPADLAPVLALQPALVLLGTGEHQVFPPAAVLGHCLSRGIGLEVMSNDAAARTYAVLAGEGRRVVVAMLLGA